MTLRLRLIEEIRRAIDFDVFAWLLTDPETSVGSSPLSDLPWTTELPTLIRLKYLTGVNRWTAIGDSRVETLRGATHGDLTRSRLWRELLCTHDVGDVASTVFRDRFGCWGFLDLWRIGAGAPFGLAEESFLSSIAGTVTTALRRCQANTFLAPAAPDPPPAGPVVLLLSPHLDVLGQTPETLEYLRLLVPPAAGQTPIPASAYNVAAQLLALEQQADSNPPWARVHLSAGLWVTLRAARIGEVKSIAERDIAVTIGKSSPAERVDLFAKAFGLSAREDELLGYLISGADTRELAHRMFLSQHTVQDHLKSIFAKTSARSRRTLLSRALGT